MLLKPSSITDIKSCSYCKTPMSLKVYAHRKYCSNSCRQRAYENRKEKKNTWKIMIEQEKKRRLKEIKRLTKVKNKLVIRAGIVNNMILQIDKDLNELVNKQ